MGGLKGFEENAWTEDGDVERDSQEDQEVGGWIILKWRIST
jgi:hypothetical protein